MTSGRLRDLLYCTAICHLWCTVGNVGDFTTTSTLPQCQPVLVCGAREISRRSLRDRMQVRCMQWWLARLDRDHCFAVAHERANKDTEAFRHLFLSPAHVTPLLERTHNTRVPKHTRTGTQCSPVFTVTSQFTPLAFLTIQHSNREVKLKAITRVFLFALPDECDNSRCCCYAAAARCRSSK